MAESLPCLEEKDDLNLDDPSELNASVLECAVCLQPCVHPAQLPCGHIFCFLCLKGFAHQSKKCAMCRQEIPSDYLDKPHLVEQSASVKEVSSFEDGYQWFYEGRNGWWQYDERTSRELETAYKKGERMCELLVAGFLYIADFDAMLQLRRTELTRKRRIKRDLATIPKKGVAGLRLEESQDEPQRAKSPSTLQSGSRTPIPPSNTPQTPGAGYVSGATTPDRSQSISQVVEQIRSMNLGGVSDASEDEQNDFDDANLTVGSTLVVTVTSDSEE